MSCSFYAIFLGAKKAELAAKIAPRSKISYLPSVKEPLKKT